MRKKVIATVSLCFLALVAAKAQNPTKTYLLLANGQGPGSTSFASAFSSSVIAHYDALGVVSRNRAIRISQLKQPLCQACNPSRRTRSCNGFRRTKPSSRPTTSLTIRPCLLLMHPPCLQPTENPSAPRSGTSIRFMRIKPPPTATAARAASTRSRRCNRRFWKS